MSDEAQQSIPEDVIKEASDALDKPLDIDLHDDRTKEFRTPGFARMQTDWNSANGEVVQSVLGILTGRLHVDFGDALAVINDLYLLVRDPVVDANGVPTLDVYGWFTWEKNGKGYLEDWTRLTIRDREHFLYRITTGLVDWEQKAQDAWTEAMLAKGSFEERFAMGYLSALNKKAEADRTAVGKAASTDERYLGIVKAAYSRKCEALVRTLTLLGQRLKDTTV